MAHATERVELMTYVTCPTVRYHPAVVAQKAATLGVLSDDRFLLGLGAGENLNEHVVGERWPAVGERHDMLEEAVEIIRELLAGERLTYDGEPLPGRLRQGVGPARREGADRHRDLRAAVDLALLAVGGPPRRGRARRRGASSTGTRERRRADLPTGRKIGQVPISWDTDAEAARQRAHEQFRWFAGGWKVNADLPTTEAFDAASQFVRPDDVAEQIACGPDLDAIVESVRPYWEAGFTDIAIVQVGDAKQQEFLDTAAGPLLEKLRAAAPSGDRRLTVGARGCQAGVAPTVSGPRSSSAGASSPRCATSNQTVLCPSGPNGWRCPSASRGR